jgi:hypothetical protein
LKSDQNYELRAFYRLVLAILSIPELYTDFITVIFSEYIL